MRAEESSPQLRSGTAMSDVGPMAGALAGVPAPAQPIRCTPASRARLGEAVCFSTTDRMR